MPLFLIPLCGAVFFGLVRLYLQLLPKAREAKRWSAIAAAVFGAVFFWELAGPGGSIRVDLLVLYPVLIGLSIATLIAVSLAIWRAR